MTNDELRDLLYRVGEALRYDCLQTEKIAALIHETDAALDAILPDEPSENAGQLGGQTLQTLQTPPASKEDSP